jgi:DNA-binding NarL/FixJ family response regulator
MSDMGFTGKQISIVSHIITGEPTKSIAGKLRVSESAIKNHLTVIYRRLGVSSRVEFMRYLHDHHVNIE